MSSYKEMIKSYLKKERKTIGSSCYDIAGGVIPFEKSKHEIILMAEEGITGQDLISLFGEKLLTEWNQASSINIIQCYTRNYSESYAYFPNLTYEETFTFLRSNFDQTVLPATKVNPRVDLSMVNVKISPKAYVFQVVAAVDLVEEQRIAEVNRIIGERLRFTEWHDMIKGEHLKGNHEHDEDLEFILTNKVKLGILTPEEKEREEEKIQLIVELQASGISIDSSIFKEDLDIQIKRLEEELSKLTNENHSGDTKQGDNLISLPVTTDYIASPAIIQLYLSGNVNQNEYLPVVIMDDTETIENKTVKYENLKRTKGKWKKGKNKLKKEFKFNCNQFQNQIDSVLKLNPKEIANKIIVFDSQGFSGIP